MGAIPFTSTFPGRVAFVLIPLYILFLYYANIAAGSYQTLNIDPETYSATELEGMLGEYQARIGVLNQQIHDTNKDLDWLQVKINRIADSGRSVPKLLHDSVRTKEEKIYQLEAQKKNLAGIVAKYQKVYGVKKVRENGQTKIQSAFMPDIQNGIMEPATGGASAGLPDIHQAVKKAGLEDWVDVMAGDGSCAKINNTLPILFSSGSAALAKEYKTFLKKISAVP